MNRVIWTHTPGFAFQYPSSLEERCKSMHGVYTPSRQLRSSADTRVFGRILSFRTAKFSGHAVLFLLLYSKNSLFLFVILPLLVLLNTPWKPFSYTTVCVCVCVCARARACVRACVRALYALNPDNIGLKTVSKRYGSVRVRRSKYPLLL